MNDTKPLEQALDGVNADRRDFLKKLLVTAAVAVPVLTTTVTGEAWALKVEGNLRDTKNVSKLPTITKTENITDRTAPDIKIDDVKVESNPTAPDIKIDPNLYHKAK